MKLKQITACLVAATFFGSNPAFAQAAKVSNDTIKI
jgi:branched-chain amino acid transport system substrate-binding protein